MFSRRSARRRSLRASIAVLALATALILPLTPLDGTSARANAAPQHGVLAPMSVPTPTGDSSVITVKVGGVGDRAVAGVRLGLFTTQTGGAASYACVSDADGDCSFVIPQTGTTTERQCVRWLLFCTQWADVQVPQANRDARFFVRAVAAPSGYRLNDALRTGEGTGGMSESTPYVFQTGMQLRAGQTYVSGRDFMADATGVNRADSGGTWQVSRANPPAALACGLDVAIVLDYSGSVAQAGETNNLVRSAATMVNSLVGTQSRASVYSFSTASPAVNAAANRSTLSPVTTQAQADAVIGHFATGTSPNYTSRWAAEGGTNWDAAFRAVAAANTAENRADVVVFVTDGNPTFGVGPTGETGPGNYTTVRQVEDGILSANVVRGQGTRVLAVGVGGGVTDAHTARNLAAISGPMAGSDYYQTLNYQDVALPLRQLALGACNGSISVTKVEVPEGGTTAQGTPASGWTMNASTHSAGVTLSGAASHVTPADGTGTVNFPLTYASGVNAGVVQVVEQQRPGFELLQVSGRNAACVVTGTTTPVSVTDVSSGFRVDVPATTPVSCTIYNRRLPTTLTVDKLWSLNGSTPVRDGQQPTWLAATPTIAGADIAWGARRTGLSANQSVAVGERMTAIPAWLPGCVVASQRITDVNGVASNLDISTSAQTIALRAGANRVMITNVVTCESRLTLVKRVDGQAQPSDWTLTATGPTTFSGAGGAAAPITPDATYTLSESSTAAGAAVYMQQGGWSCGAIDRAGRAIDAPGWTDAADAMVSVPPGMHVTCTVTNQTARLTLLKQVVNDNGGRLGPQDFALTATPASAPAVSGLNGFTVAGASAATSSNTREVRPGHAYALTEDMGEYAYLGQSIQRYTGPANPTAAQLAADGNWQALTAAQASAFTVGASEHAYVRFVNDDAPALALPLTGGIGADTYLFGGAGVLLLGLLTAAALLVRTRIRSGREARLT